MGYRSDSIAVSRDMGPLRGEFWESLTELLREMARGGGWGKVFSLRSCKKLVGELFFDFSQGNLAGNLAANFSGFFRTHKAQRAQRSKKFEISSEIENFERE